MKHITLVAPLRQDGHHKPEINRFRILYIKLFEKDKTPDSPSLEVTRLLLRVAQVKCYNCGRTCAEVVGRSVRDLNLNAAYVPQYAAEYGLSEGLPPRCQRYGGSVYIDEPFTVGLKELLASGIPFAVSGVENENLGVAR